MRKTRYASMVALALASVMILSTAALGAVTFDPETGEGFVGKGDVQLAFGWNNKALQDNAAGVTFSYAEVGEYTVRCSRQHPQQGYQEMEFKNREIGVESAIDYEKRRNGGVNNQITGFLLTGLGEETTSGDACPTGWPDEVSRSLNPDAGETVGLFAHYQDTSVQLDWPAAE
jgi:hypothetical protein